MDNRLASLPSVTPEDDLFRGWALILQNPADSLNALNKAIIRRRSPLALVMRAEAARASASQTGSLGQAETSVADIHAARAMLPDSPFIRSMNVVVQTVAASVFGHHGWVEKRQEALAEAQRDAQALKPYDTLPFVVLGLYDYFELHRSQEELYELARRAAERTQVPLVLISWTDAMRTAKSRLWCTSISATATC
jgi:hypothetical protein